MSIVIKSFFDFFIIFFPLCSVIILKEEIMKNNLLKFRKSQLSVYQLALAPAIDVNR